ncbi:hypothetical protein VIAQ111709_06440 [Vibrio aquimaris]|uniref:Uncharacterized protein n=1 Tax=Vibrio aquimaris TaxID=2587862 RepID=A0A5P9CHF0_9VIBR|nr:hypothetical protein FIV01_04590 [Vibrio aquimaris]
MYISDLNVVKDKIINNGISNTYRLDSKFYVFEFFFNSIGVMFYIEGLNIG